MAYPRQFSSCTKAVRSLEIFVTKADTVFSHVKEEVAADRVGLLFFELCLQFIHLYSVSAL